MATTASRMIRLFAAALALGAMAPAHAQWRHEASGAVFPASLGELRLKTHRELAGPHDVVADYAADGEGVESTTLYVTRAAMPDPRLWFDRALFTVQRDIPTGIFVASPVETIAAFGRDARGVQQLFEAPEAGPFRSTALVVARAGPWLVKMRASSASLDMEGLRTRIAETLAAIAMPPGADPPALSIDECPDRAPAGGGRAVAPDGDQLVPAMVAGFAGYGKLSAAAGEVCRAAHNPTGTMLIDRAGTGWIMLLGDSGRAVASVAGDGATHLAAVMRPDGLVGAALFDGPPPINEAFAASAPLLREGDGMFRISADSLSSASPAPLDSAAGGT